MTKPKLPEGMQREFEVDYWFGAHRKTPDARGFPKTETGVRKKDGKVQSLGAAGALRMINAGWASKIQCVHRPTGTVVWTALRQKVPGLNVYTARIVPGAFDFTTKER